MRIAIPVECQNGHKATWYMLVKGLDVCQLGVPQSEKCNCPKWGEGQGYHAAGAPYAASEDEEVQA